jgi:hypothetical protein
MLQYPHGRLQTPGVLSYGRSAVVAEPAGGAVVAAISKRLPRRRRLPQELALGAS